MTASTPRRRRVAARSALIAGALALVGAGYGAITAASSPAAASAPSAAQQITLAHGESLFNENCATCHGFQAQGKAGVAPSLIGVGAAAVNFQVGTGRMPLAENEAEAAQKPVRFTPRQISQMASYVESLGGGPQVPTASMVNPASADIALGQSLFIANCAQCHNYAGSGGALTYGKYAPALSTATPTQIYEAMETGPEAMPVFSDGIITPSEKRDVISYVVNERSQVNPGGFSLGRIGPVTEGLVTFLGLLFFMILAALWITAKQGKERPGVPAGQVMGAEKDE